MYELKQTAGVMFETDVPEDMPGIVVERMLEVVGACFSPAPSTPNDELLAPRRVQAECTFRSTSAVHCSVCCMTWLHDQI